MSGKLAAWAAVAGELHALYTVPASAVAAVTVRACNRSDAGRLIWMALSVAQPQDADYIEWSAPLGPRDVMENTGIVLAAGQSVYVKADLTGISFVCWGIEEML